MGASLWDQMGLPLLIGVASPIIVAALCFLSARLWKCLVQQITTQTAVGDADDTNALPDLEMGTINGGEVHAQPLRESDAHANAEPDLEMRNGSGPAEGGESMAEPELELGIVNSDELAPKAQVTRDAATGALVPVEMDVPHSQQEEAAE